MNNSAMDNGIWLTVVAMLGLLFFLIFRWRSVAARGRPEWLHSADDFGWPGTAEPAADTESTTESGFKLTAFDDLPGDLVVEGWRAEAPLPDSQVPRKRLTAKRRPPAMPALRRRGRALRHSV